MLDRQIGQQEVAFWIVNAQVEHSATCPHGSKQQLIGWSKQTTQTASSETVYLVPVLVDPLMLLAAMLSRSCQPVPAGQRWKSPFCSVWLKMYHCPRIPSPRFWPRSPKPIDPPVSSEYLTLLA
jgi:hypothetical protein